MKRAVFLDRDGVINEDSEEFIKSPDELKIFPGVREDLIKLQNAGFLLVVITNQSGIQRGILNEHDLAEIHQSMRDQLAPAVLTGIYYCPHGPDDDCECRKPKPGMLISAAEDHDIDLGNSFLIGDRWSDISCGKAVGATTMLILTGKTVDYCPEKFVDEPDYIVPTLTEATRIILFSV